MKIFPAIDIRNKQAVRLTQGDFGKMIIYADDTLRLAKEFEADGAECLHLVDLDGALNGELVNFDTIKSIAENTGLFIEVGGGIRTEDRIEKYLNAGVSRVILGTVAVDNFDFVKEMIVKYGNKIAVGVDAKNGFVAINGWKTVTEINAFDFCVQLRNIGLETVIYTDISKDGMLQGANLEAYAMLQKIDGLKIVASGGITYYDEIKKLAKDGVYGAILGKALYENKLKLKDALLAAEV